MASFFLRELFEEFYLSNTFLQGSLREDLNKFDGHLFSGISFLAVEYNALSSDSYQIYELVLGDERFEQRDIVVLL
jgi:hypothetical protein